MSGSDSYRTGTRMLCIISVVLFPLIATGLVNVSAIIGIPMNLAIVLIGVKFFMERRSKSSRWDGSVPPLVRALLVGIALLGVGSIVFGFNGVMPSYSPTGKAVHELSAHIKDGMCYATFNGVSPVKMGMEFCKHYNIYFSTVFCGFWLLFSAALHWASWMRRSD